MASVMSVAIGITVPTSCTGSTKSPLASKNLSEQNQTLVNDRPIEEHELRERDEIRIGPYTCTYRCVHGDAGEVREQLVLRGGTSVTP